MTGQAISRLCLMSSPRTRDPCRPSHATALRRLQKRASLGVIGPEPEHLLVFRGTFFDPAQAHQDRAKDVVGIRILAIAPDGLPQLDDRLGEASLSRQAPVQG